MKILLIRMMGLGDVASILIPAVKLVRHHYPQSSIHVLTYAAGNELMELVPEVDAVLAVTPEQWPSDLDAAIQSFMDIADRVVLHQYDQIVNLDTWFMPCFLARILKDTGHSLHGNYINYSINEFFQKLHSRALSQAYFQDSTQFLDSSFPNMPDWTIPWWDKYSDSGAYPEFYLRHCCGFDGDVDVSLPVEADLAFKQQAMGKKIIALSSSGSKVTKQYTHAAQLRTELEQAGFFVWGQFDGSVPMQTTLGRLKVTDLLVTVATSSQWLAKLVGCPSLLIPGALPPSVLGPDLVVDKIQQCQYCYQNHCPQNVNFACMDVPADQVLVKVLNHFRKH